MIVVAQDEPITARRSTAMRRMYPLKTNRVLFGVWQHPI
jgi:hypothetical protein